MFFLTPALIKLVCYALMHPHLDFGEIGNSIKIIKLLVGKKKLERSGRFCLKLENQRSSLRNYEGSQSSHCSFLLINKIEAKISH